VETQAEVKFQQVAVKYLHHVEVVVQQISQWQEKIQLLCYDNFEEMSEMTQKNTCLFVRRYGQKEDYI
jgi:phage host-nuclease inhibitor protein Gam